MAEANPPLDSSGHVLISRRQFVSAAGMATLATSLSAVVPRPTSAASASALIPAGPHLHGSDETPVARFHRALDDKQRRRLCFPFDHPKRSWVGNHWAIVKPTIHDLSRGQQALCLEILRDLCSHEGYARFETQMRDDAGGFENYHVAVFGEPESETPFEWVLTGRHCTLRADGHSPGGVAFGGPLFFGHAVDTRYGPGADPGSSSNVWWDQAALACRLFDTLAPIERSRAMGAGCEPHLVATGLPVAMLDDRQKAMVRLLLAGLAGTFRVFHVEEVQECLREPHGADELRLSFFQGAEIWKLEGRSFTWQFHGSPHVHSWLNVHRQVMPS